MSKNPRHVLDSKCVRRLENRVRVLAEATVARALKIGGEWFRKINWFMFFFFFFFFFLWGGSFYFSRFWTNGSEFYWIFIDVTKFLWFFLLQKSRDFNRNGQMFNRQTARPKHGQATEQVSDLLCRHEVANGCLVVLIIIHSVEAKTFSEHSNKKKAANVLNGCFLKSG